MVSILSKLSNGKNTIYRSLSCRRGGIVKHPKQYIITKSFKKNYVIHNMPSNGNKKDEIRAHFIYNEILRKSRLKPQLNKYNVNCEAVADIYQATTGVAKGKYFAYRRFKNRYLLSKGQEKKKDAETIKKLYLELEFHNHSDESEDVNKFRQEHNDNSHSKERNEVDTTYAINHSFSQSKFVRHNLMTIQKSKCNCCDNELSPGFTSEHIIPIKYGGKDEPGNLQALCDRCNQFKNTIVDPHIDEMWNFNKQFSKLDILQLQTSLFESFCYKNKNENMGLLSKISLFGKIIIKSIYWSNYIGIK